MPLALKHHPAPVRWWLGSGALAWGWKIRDPSLPKRHPGLMVTSPCGHCFTAVIVQRAGQSAWCKWKIISLSLYCHLYLRGSSRQATLRKPGCCPCPEELRSRRDGLCAAQDTAAIQLLCACGVRGHCMLTSLSRKGNVFRVSDHGKAGSDVQHPWLQVHSLNW